MQVTAAFVRATVRVSGDDVRVVCSFAVPAQDLASALKAQAYWLGKLAYVSVDGAVGRGVLRSVSVDEEHESVWTFEVELSALHAWLPGVVGKSVTLSLKKRENDDGEGVS